MGNYFSFPFSRYEISSDSASLPVNYNTEKHHIFSVFSLILEIETGDLVMVSFHNEPQFVSCVWQQLQIYNEFLVKEKKIIITGHDIFDVTY